MPSSPLVSVVLPAHDYGRFLGAAIDSVLAQEYPGDRVELIVVDDGSTDDTPEVVAGYGDRLRSVRQPNRGVNAANERGIGLATGELLTFLDADDTWPVDRLRVLVDALGAHPEAGLVYGDMTVLGPDDQVLAPSYRAATGLVAHSGAVYGELVPGNFVSAGATMVRTALREHFHPFPAHVGWHDWWIALQVARVSPVLAIPATVNRYRFHGENLNLGASGRRLAELFAAELDLRRWLLVTSPADVVGAVNLVVALRRFDSMLAHVARAQFATLDEVLPVEAEEREETVRGLHLASEALDAGDELAALGFLVAAAALDPSDARPRGVIDELAPLLTIAAPAEPLAPSVP